MYGVLFLALLWLLLAAVVVYLWRVALHYSPTLRGAQRRMWEDVRSVLHRNGGTK